MKLSVTAAAAALLVAGSAAQAAGVLPGGNVGVTFDSDIETAPLSGNGLSISGGDCDDSDLSGCDILVTSGGFNYGFDFSDEDTFRVALQDDFFADGPSDLTVDAQFSIASGHEITGVVPAPSSSFLGFLFDPINNDTSPITDPTFPAISFSSQDGDPAGLASVLLQFSGIQSGWWPDGGYFLDFDITFAPIGGGGPEVIPLPAPALLLGTAILGLAGLRKRRRSEG